MKFTDILEDILGQKPKIKALRYLLNTNLELTGRELSRVLGIHHRTVHEALKELAGFGVVTIQQSGKALVYKINNRNLLVAKLLRPIFSFEKELLNRSLSAIVKRTKVPIISVIVYGSVAASLERGTSDIDVLFLVSGEKEKGKLSEALDKLDYDFVLKYGNMLSPLVFTISEFLSRLKKKEGLVQNIIQQGRSVYGKSIQEVLILCQRKG